jgi:hypothetical protein
MQIAPEGDPESGTERIKNQVPFAFFSVACYIISEPKKILEMIK